MNELPYLIDFPSNGSLEIGYLSIAESDKLPFIPQRTFWAFHTPDSVVRGRHAHFNTEMILIAVSGIITVNTEDISGNLLSFRLENPRQGLFVPKLNWHTMIYSHNAVQLVLASTKYDEKDYIREYNEFQKLQNTSTI
jgi:hypothetical protein